MAFTKINLYVPATSENFPEERGVWSAERIANQWCCHRKITILARTPNRFVLYIHIVVQFIGVRFLELNTTAPRGMEDAVLPDHMAHSCYFIYSIAVPSKLSYKI